MANMGNLVAGFLQGFARSSQRSKELAMMQEVKKAQLKKFKADQDIQEQRVKFGEEFLSQFEPSSAPAQGEEGPPAQPEQAKTLTEILSDPEGQMAGLRSGIVSTKDIGMAQERKQTSALLDQINVSEQVGGGLGFTPESKLQFAATRDPKVLKRIDPVKNVVQMEDGPHTVMQHPQTGEILTDLGPVKEEKVTAEQAGKISSIEFAKEQLGNAVNLLAPGGQVDKAVVAQLSLPGAFLTGKALEIDQLLSEAISTKVLIQSGVTAREDEVEATKARFMPTIRDLTREGLAERKLTRLKEFMEGALDLTTLPPSLRKKIETRRKKQKTKPTLDIGRPKENVVDFEDL